MTDKIDNFTHLHLHTQYSLLDGAIKIDSLMKRVADFGMKSVAITDHGTMFGVLEFYEKAVYAGIKPLIGCECYIAPRKLTDKTTLDSKGLSHLVLLAKNNEGYRNLCKLATIAQLEGFYHKPRIDKDVLKFYSKGLIALSACLHGEIPKLILEKKDNAADDLARIYLDIFGENNFFLELQNNGLEKQETVNSKLLDMSKRLSIPLVATNDCHYLSKEDASAHELLLCIQTGKTINSPDRFRFDTDQLYLKSSSEMYDYFSKYPKALENTEVIAKRCNVEFDLLSMSGGEYHFPKFDDISSDNIDEKFEMNVSKGYEKRIKHSKLNNSKFKENVYQERLAYEIDVIKNMGFAGYFLIVADIINFAKENNVPVGPGRGSAAGSLVAYSMGITDLDPIEHGLIFERFLNPGRKSMPDIDIDFCINGREKVFKYVVERYGNGVQDVNAVVAQIITFGKLKAKAVIRDVGRVLEIPLRQVDVIAKMVPDVVNISLDAALEMEPEIKKMAKQQPEVDKLINVCRVLEGLTRHASTHAAGVVIGDKPLVEYLPLYKGKHGEVVTQFDMKYVEQTGLVKFDFLGLRNLTVIESTLSLIEKQGKIVPDVLKLDFFDEKTYRLLGKGDTTGVFQLESSGMKDLLVRLKPACFDDIIALVALYRPGPLNSGMVDDFVKRKHGKQAVEYIVPELETILKETYGVIVYQEQVMKIAVELADYSMAEADGLRKAMGKKIASIMDEHEKRFLEGAVKNNIPLKKASQIFTLMKEFGQYGFNKSHSAAYALIAYQTAYLKAHFSVEFMAALLTSEMNSTGSVVKYISECKSHKITILPPDINESDKGFVVSGLNIRFGLAAVKNVGESAIESILSERKKKFSSLFEFCERVELKKVNKKVIEGLIKCGAFDSFNVYRSRLMASVEDVIAHGQRVQKEKSDKQLRLFDLDDFSHMANCPDFPDIEKWDEKEMLAFEKEALGFYITGHPLDKYDKIIQKYTTTNTISIKEVNCDTGI